VASDAHPALAADAYPALAADVRPPVPADAHPTVTADAHGPAVPAALAPPVPLLFLVADTGGGHRAAAGAVSQALSLAYPGRFAPVLCDPLGGPGSSWLLRRITGLYGPAIRLARPAWAAAYYASDSRPAMWLLRRTVLALADRPVAREVARHQPAAIVSFHPLTGAAAASGRRRGPPGTAVLTVVTDLVRPHAAWRYGKVDQIVVPSDAVRRRWHLDGPEPDRCAQIGLPVTAGFWDGPARPAERAALRRSLAVSEGRFLVLLTGGGEGCGGIARRAAAILRRLDGVHLVVICGRNRRLQARLGRLAARAGGRLTVHGFVGNMADWLRCADVCVSKAGPGTIAEATCCGTPLLLTSHLPGQERGNTELVVRAGAGRAARGTRGLVSEIGGLLADPAAVEAMRVASARLARPAAAAEIATALARRAGGGHEPS
jgi:1,2-diacylglycerol 3-beta-galactosyltransferase